MQKPKSLRIAHLVSLVSLCVLTACASGPTRKDCEAKDYYKMGLEDGEKGHTNEQFQEMASACSKAGAPADQTKYTYGRQVGLAKYCDEGRAKKDAQNGQADVLCMKEHVPPYETAYAREIEQRRKKTEADIQDLNKSQENLKAKKEKKQSELEKLNSQNPAPPAH